MLTLVDSTELNVSVLPGRLVLCKLGSSGEDGSNKLLVSCVGATSANKVRYIVKLSTVLIHGYKFLKYFFV